MKKLRLFLLTWIVSILSIVSFTNAEDLKLLKSYTFNTSDSPSTIGINMSDYCDSSDQLKYDSICVKISPIWDIWNAWFDFGCTHLQIKTYLTPTCISLSDVRCGCTSNNIKLYWSNFAWSSVFVYTKVPTLPINNQSLTPAINWLHDTVWEIIPYVLYIWIWVLLAILWFYWIRRLVNRIVWKINSIFRSKRN